MWLTKFKIAIIETNTDTIETLLDELPQFNTTEEMDEAQYLLKEAAALLLNEKNKTEDTMKQIQKNLSYLHATKEKSIGSLDIKL